MDKLIRIFAQPIGFAGTAFGIAGLIYLGISLASGGRRQPEIVSEDMSALLGDSRSIIEDFLREQCALYYPTAVEAECNGILTADFNANEYRVDFSLKDTEDQQLTGITVVYHLSTKQCELM